MSAPSRSLSLEGRRVLYDKAMLLLAEGRTVGETARALGVGYDMVKTWKKGNKPVRVARHEPDLTPSPNLAYVLGFYLGDGARAGTEGKVRFKLADRAQAEIASEKVASILGCPAKPPRIEEGFFVVSYDAVILSRYLESPIGRFAELIRMFPADFLRGFFDAEGYASCSVNMSNHSVGPLVVGAANTNLQYLRTVESTLNMLGLHPRWRLTNKKGGLMTIRGKTWTRKKDVHHLVFCKHADIRLFLTRVGFLNPAKAERLQTIDKLLSMPSWSRFGYFTSNHQKEGRKWVRTTK